MMAKHHRQPHAPSKAPPMASPKAPAVPLWRLADFCAAMDADLAPGAPDCIDGISIDSRTIAAGDAFFAIRGDRFDGHDFVDSALQRGAACAVVARERAAEYRDRTRLVVVEDVLAGLGDLARAARARTQAKVIAITGSVGKTTTKEMLATALGACGATHAAPASFNNHWGVPLTLARMPRDSEYAVIEIGMNHPGEITPLTRLTRPDVAIITTVDAVHLAHFSNVEEIARAKAEIFAGIAPGGKAILNMDNPHYLLLERLCRQAGVHTIISFGGCPLAQCRLIGRAAGVSGAAVKASVLGETLHYRLSVSGRHLVDNSLAVVAAVKTVGADLARSALALAGMRAPPGRGERHGLQLEDGRALLIDESYNANPASMGAAIGVLGEIPLGARGRRIAVLGDMLELGPTSEALHGQLAHALIDAEIDRVYLVGPHMQALWRALPAYQRAHWTEQAGQIAEPILNDIRDGDIIMVKGSLGTGMAAIVTALRDACQGAGDSDNDDAAANVPNASGATVIRTATCR